MGISNHTHKHQVYKRLYMLERSQSITGSYLPANISKRTISLVHFKHTRAHLTISQDANLQISVLHHFFPITAFHIPPSEQRTDVSALELCLVSVPHAPYQPLISKLRANLDSLAAIKPEHQERLVCKL